MEFPVLDMSGKEVSTVELPAEIFGISREDINVGLMHQAFVRQMANARQGTHKTKTRSEVRISKAKLYRQKGTGRARHGSKNAPIFVGGGQAHGPRPRSYVKKMPREMRRGAVRHALSVLVSDEQLLVVDQFVVESHKTKDMRALLGALVGEQSALVLLPERNETAERGIRNLPNARYLRASYLNIRDLLNYDKVIMPLDALEVIKQIWGKGE